MKMNVSNLLKIEYHFQDKLNREEFELYLKKLFETENVVLMMEDRNLNVAYYKVEEKNVEKAVLKLSQNHNIVYENSKLNVSFCNSY